LVSELILTVVRAVDLILDEKEIMILWKSKGFRGNGKYPPLVNHPIPPSSYYASPPPHFPFNLLLILSTRIFVTITT
jgi:hypothetical protein